MKARKAAKKKWQPAFYWNDWYKSDHGSACVHFAGGFQLYVMRNNDAWNITSKWRVWWGDKKPKIKGLSGKWFGTRRAAMRAAENVFLPMLLIAPSLISCRAELVMGDALKVTPAKKRRP